MESVRLYVFDSNSSFYWQNKTFKFSPSKLRSRLHPVVVIKRQLKDFKPSKDLLKIHIQMEMQCTIFVKGCNSVNFLVLTIRRVLVTRRRGQMENTNEKRSSCGQIKMEPWVSKTKFYFHILFINSVIRKLCRKSCEFFVVVFMRPVGKNGSCLL